MFALLSCKNKTKCLKINLLLYFEESFVDSYKIESRDVSLVLPVRTITVSSNTGSPRKHELYRFLYFIPAPL